MQDRVPLYPGRVILTPVAGQANTYDMVRADQPTQVGTPLNKATFLKDNTAALYGLGVTAVPDDVLAKLKTLVDSAKSSADAKARIETGSYVGTGTGSVQLSFSGLPRLVFVQEDYIRNGGKYGAFFTNPAEAAAVRGDGSSAYGGMSVTWGTSSVSWTDTSSETKKWLNESGYTYYYVAIL